MKNFENYPAEKYYNNDRYSFIEEGIYLFRNLYDSIDENGMYVYGRMRSSDIKPDYYVTSLVFEQEPELGEGSSPQMISLDLLGDLSENYFVYVSDFYDQLNEESDSLCYLEFGSPDIDDVRNLRTVIGKHVFNVEYEEDGKIYILLVIE